MLITSQLYNYGGKGWMYCISDGTSCRLPGRLISEGLSLWGGEENIFNFRFCIESDSWRISLCFRSLYIWAILWKSLQYILGSLWLALFFLKLDKLLTPCTNFLFVLHFYSPFHWHTWWLGRNTWRVKLSRILLLPHHNLIYLMGNCNFSER